MIEEALDMFPPPDKHGVIFVGDSMTDMMAAGRAKSKRTIDHESFSRHGVRVESLERARRK